MAADGRRATRSACPARAASRLVSGRPRQRAEPRWARPSASRSLRAYATRTARRLRQRGAQQHHGEPEAARARHAVLVEHGADGPDHRGDASAGRLPAAGRLAPRARHVGMALHEAHAGSSARLSQQRLGRPRQRRCSSEPEHGRPRSRRRAGRVDAGGHTMLDTPAPSRSTGATAQEEQAAAIEPLGDGSDRAPAPLGLRRRAAPVGDATRRTRSGRSAAPIDNLNGDNVEFVSDPVGRRPRLLLRVLRLRRPRAAARSSSRSAVNDIPESTAAQTVNFKGNISFANNDPVGHPDDGTFATDIERHGRRARRRSSARPGPRGTSGRSRTPALATGAVSCTSAGGPNGHSAIRNPDPNATRPHGVDVDLVDGDVVTCTFTNTFIPPVGLVVRKITRGGFGSFPIDVSGFAPFTLTTTRDRQPGRAHPRRAARVHPHDHRDAPRQRRRHLGRGVGGVRRLHRRRRQAQPHGAARGDHAPDGVAGAARSPTASSRTA